MLQPSEPQSYRWLLLLSCIVSILAVGCPAITQFEPNAGVIEAMGLPQAQQRLKEILLHAAAPAIDEVEVTEEFVRYHLTRTVVDLRIVFRDVYNAEVYSNNVVLIYGRTREQILARPVLATPEDAITFADLILGFARSVRRSSMRFAPPPAAFSHALPQR